MQIDEIIFCDTGMEFPEMYEHIDKVEKYIGMPITRLKPEKSFEYWMLHHVKTRGKRKGNKGYGWAAMGRRWCTRVLKQQVTAKYLKEQGDYIQYIGIAYDEPIRHERVTDNTVHPLFDWQITEAEALAYCYSKGFDWSGLYERFHRVSCWCCPLQRMGELQMLYKHHPDLWEKLKELDADTPYPFKNKYKVIDIEKRFQDPNDKYFVPLTDPQKE